MFAHNSSNSSYNCKPTIIITVSCNNYNNDNGDFDDSVAIYYDDVGDGDYDDCGEC